MTATPPDQLVTAPDPIVTSRELSGPPDASSSSAVFEGYAHSVMNTFGPPKRVFVRGEGCYVWDADGRRYLDLMATSPTSLPRRPRSLWPHA